MKDLKPHFLFLALLAVVYQFYCGIYLGFFLVIPVAIMLFTIFVYKRKELLKNIKSLNWNFKVLLALSINIALLLILMIPYLNRSQQTELYYYWDIIDTVPTLRSYFFSQEGSLVWDFLANTSKDYPAFWDHQIFTGGIAMIGLIIFIGLGFKSIFYRKFFSALNLNKETWVILITTLLTFVFYTRYKGYSFYYFLYNLPGYNSMRSQTRIINIELIFYGFAIALITVLLFKYFKKNHGILFLAMLMLVTLDNYFKPEMSYKMEKSVSQQRVNNLIEKMKEIPKGSVVSYEFKGVVDSEAYHQIDGMLAAQTLDLKSINGYTATIPNGYFHYAMTPSKTSRDNWFKEKKIKPDTVFVITN